MQILGPEGVFVNRVLGLGVVWGFGDSNKKAVCWLARWGMKSELFVRACVFRRQGGGGGGQNVNVVQADSHFSSFFDEGHVTTNERSADMSCTVGCHGETRMHHRCLSASTSP